jgi:uncharacterized protein YlxW (UPF0749 family)
MISDELRKKFSEMIKTNPQQAIKELEREPKLLEILLNDQTELTKTKQELNNERTKYVNMTAEMQRQLQAKAAELNTTQGLLIGAGILFLLSQMKKR